MPKENQLVLATDETNPIDSSDFSSARFNSATRRCRSSSYQYLTNENHSDQQI